MHLPIQDAIATLAVALSLSSLLQIESVKAPPRLPVVLLVPPERRGPFGGHISYDQGWRVLMNSFHPMNTPGILPRPLIIFQQVLQRPLFPNSPARHGSVC